MVNRPALARCIAAFEALQHRLMAVHAPEFTAVDLTMAQAKLLYVLMAGGELTLTDIASRLRVTASTTSGAVDHLVGLGLVTRAEDPTNRRQIRVSIAPQGIQALEQISELGRRQMELIFGGVDDRDLLVVEQAIAVMTKAVTALEANQPAGTSPGTGTESRSVA